MTISNHYAKDRQQRNKAIESKGKAVVLYTVYAIGKDGKVQEKEVDTNGVVTVYKLDRNRNRIKVITKFFARKNVIARDFKKYENDDNFITLLNTCKANEKAKLNKICR